MLKEYLVCGQITRSHGINGAMVVNPLCDSYEVFEGLKTIYLENKGEYTPLKVKKCSPYKSSAIVLTDAITNPEDVTRLRMSYVYAKRSDIAKSDDDFFIVDIIGLDVYDFNTGVKYGTLKDVINQGAQDIYVIARENAPDGYVPVVNEFVKEISLEKGIAISPIEGMLD